MKKFILLFTIFLSFGMNISAQEVKINEHGENYVLISRPLTAEEKKAVENPGMEIPVISDITFKRTGFFHYEKIRSYDEAKVFKEDSLQTLKKSGSKPGEKVFAWNIIVLLIAIFLMAFSNKIHKKDKWFAGLVAFATALATVFATVFAAALAAALATLAALVVDTRKMYHATSAIFYIAALAAVFIDYIV